jgi:hypothetical protein
MDSLCIMFGGVELDYTKTLSDYGIEHEDTLRIEIFEITILQWSGEMFTLNSVGPNNTTYDVKNKIADSKSIPPGQQIISLKGQVLNDVLRLKDQGIKHRSVLMLNQPKENLSLPVMEKVSLSLFKTSGTDWGKEGNDISSTFSFDDLPSESSHHSLTDKKATTQDSKVAKKKKSDRDNGGSGKRTKSSSSRSKERESSKEKKKKKDKTVKTEKSSKKKKETAKGNGGPSTVTSRKKKKTAKDIESPGTVTSKKKKKIAKDIGSPGSVMIII